MEATMIMATLLDKGRVTGKKFFTYEQMTEILRAEGNSPEQIRAFFSTIEKGTITTDAAQFELVLVLEGEKPVISEKFGTDFNVIFDQGKK
jgi:hypothetical protein